MTMAKCDICQRQYDAKHDHVCQPMHYAQVLPGTGCDLAYTSLMKAAGQCGKADTYYLYVNPDDVAVAHGVALHAIHMHQFWVNVIARPGLKRYEWVVAANGEFIGSEGT
jgi:hypothetical protein